MDNKELYRQELQAQLDEWKAEIEKLRANASSAGAKAQLDLNHQIYDLEERIGEGEAKVAEIAKASDAAWETMKDEVDSSWRSLKTAFTEAADKIKRQA